MATRELLSVHKTVATFDGLTEQQCLFRTALCPNECGHGGTTATFSIKKYLHYEKPGKYGDKESKKYHVRPKEDLEQSGMTEEIKSAFEALQAGDNVLLSWNHDYVTRGGCSSPERPITELKKITAEEAANM